jgi:membrane peptidoglycan carboxypeptidase
MYVKNLLSTRHGYSEKTIEQGGLRVYTTLDLYKQEIAEEVLKEQVKKNEANYNASNAALVSVDPKSGQILAMVGSRNFFDEEIDGQFNVATALRQPGSSIKPIVYAAAFEKGYTPNTILYDVVTNFAVSGTPYEPKNYTLEEHGPVSIRKALAGSLNVPAVKAIYLAGVDNVLDLAERMGYTSLKDRDRFGLSLVLGGGEVRLLEHVNAFSAFAREGEIYPIVSILKIEDKDGKTLFESSEKPRKALDANYARMINDVMSDNEARAYAFGANNLLTLRGRPVATKTGTTNDYRDAWTVGYTPSIVTGVWVGNNDNSEMKRGAAGAVVAAPIWNNYMNKVLGDTPVESFRELGDIKTGKPIIDGDISGGEKVKIDIASGLLATEYTPKHYIEEKRFAQHHSILYYIDRKNPLGDPPKKPESDPQFTLWESRVQEWTLKNATSTEINGTAPTEYDNLHVPENFPELKINYPSNNQIISEPLLRAEVEASAPRGINRVEYYIDNALIANSYSAPFTLEQNISFLGNGFHTLKTRACDDVDNCTEKSSNFNLRTDQETRAEKLQVSLLEPLASVAYNNLDFPLFIKARINNPEQTAKIIVRVYDEGGKEIESVNIEPIKNSEPEGLWRLIPPSGAYSLQAEAIGWLGQNEKSERVNITITDYE